MSSKSYPNDIIAQAADVLTAYRQIDPDLKPGTLTQAAFAEELSQMQAMQSQIQAVEKQLTDLRNRRDARLAVLWDNVKRARASVKGTYGDDSSEYELVGGTRRSDRKRAIRRSEGPAA